MRRLESTPVDVAGTSSDGELDDHLWLRLSQRAATNDDMRLMSDDHRAYYATRHFESEIGSGGPTGFLDWGRDVAPFVESGYRHLGLEGAARAFEAFWSSPITQRLVAHHNADLDQNAEATIAALAAAVGTHDIERLAFVRAHPQSFSI
jgi:hypothetical protein